MHYYQARVAGWRSSVTLESTTSASVFPLALDFGLGFKLAPGSFADIDLLLTSDPGSPAGLGDSRPLGLEAFRELALDLCFNVAGVGVGAPALPPVPVLDFVLMTTRVLDLESGLAGGECDTYGGERTSGLLVLGALSLELSGAGLGLARDLGLDLGVEGGIVEGWAMAKVAGAGAVDGESTSIASFVSGTLPFSTTSDPRPSGSLVGFTWVRGFFADLRRLLEERGDPERVEETEDSSVSSSPSLSSPTGLARFRKAREERGGSWQPNWSQDVNLSSWRVESARKRARLGSVVCLPS